MLVQGVYAEDWHEIVMNWYVDDFIDKSLLAQASLLDRNNFGTLCISMRSFYGVL